MRVVYTYALIDPLTFKPRYVGKSANPKARLQGHLQERCSSDFFYYSKSHWLETLHRMGQKPVLIILATGDFELIFYNVLKQMGCVLTNVNRPPFRGYIPDMSKAECASMLGVVAGKAMPELALPREGAARAAGEQQALVA